MKHHRTFPGLALSLAILVFGTAPVAAQDGEPAVEELIEKNLEAKGGREKLESVETARLTGTMTLAAAGQQTEGFFTVEWKAPEKSRMDFFQQGKKLFVEYKDLVWLQAYDGEIAWMINLFLGQASAQKMSEEEARSFASFRDQAHFHGPLFRAEEKGYEIEYVGQEEVEGTPMFKLEVTKPGGEETFLFLDQDSYLEIESVSKRTVRGQEVETEMAIGDYKEVDGLLMAHSLEATAAGGGFNMTITEAELNPEIPDERFEMPEEQPDSETGPKGDGR